MQSPKKPRQLNPLKSGWTRWQMPIMRGYIMKCCDCGLEHEMEFEVVQIVGKKSKNGWYQTKDIKNGRVRMRAKRSDGK